MHWMQTNDQRLKSRDQFVRMVNDFSLSLMFQPGVVGAFRVMLESVNEHLTSSELVISNEWVKEIPERILERTDHFWVNPPKRMLLSAWTHKTEDLDIMIEKFTGGEQSLVSDDMWRITGEGWSVVFLEPRSYALHHSVEQTYHDYNDKFIILDYLYTGMRRILLATLLQLDGDVDNFLRDATMWKLSITRRN